MKKWLAFTLAFALLLSMAGCAQASAPAEASAETVIFTDDCGREVEVPAEQAVQIQRVMEAAYRAAENGTVETV